MPLFTTLTLMAQAFSGLPAIPAQDVVANYSGKVACNPDPSKNRGCFRDAPGTVTAQTDIASKKVKRVLVSCSPDPSKNRGCFRSVDRPVKAGVYADAE